MFNREVWSQVCDWALVPFASAEVYRVTLTDGTTAYLRPDDGSARLLPDLAVRGVMTPSALVKRDGWLLLSEVPGSPASDTGWRAHPDSLVRLLAAAWQSLESAVGLALMRTVGWSPADEPELARLRALY